MHAESRMDLRRTRAALVLVWIAAAAYVWSFADRGWVPHDEGTIALSALNVLQGDVPHRDFGEPYTGGLTALHATAFGVFGIRLLSLRFVLFGFFLAFVPCFFMLAVRVLSIGPAVLLTLLAVAWSVPNYFASLPSWYNLFFAAFGLLAAVRHVETGRARWIFLAGVCAGLSIAVKIVGLYDVAAVALFLAYREQQLASARGDAPRGGFTAVFGVKACGGAVLLGCVLLLLRRRLDAAGVIAFFLPVAVLVAVLLWSEWKEGRGSFRERWRGAWGLLAPFGAGVLGPLAIVALAYAHAGALPDLVRGLSTQPLRHIETSRTPLPSAATLLPAIPFGLLLVVPGAFAWARRRVALVVWTLLLAVLLMAASSDAIYRIIWESARWMGVVVVVVGGARLRASSGRPGTAASRQVLFLFLSAAAWLGFVQFPFAAPIYFCFVAPVVALAVAALVSSEPAAPRPIHAALMGFYLLFAVVWLNRGYVYNLGRRPAVYRSDAILALPRGGLRVPAVDARVYPRLVERVRARAGRGGLYAGPDCTEVYFLAGYRNPTRYFFDFLGGLDTDPDALVRLLDEKGIDVVVLNRVPGFSQPPAEGVREALRAARFSHEEEIGRFTLFWRGPTTPPALAYNPQP